MLFFAEADRKPDRSLLRCLRQAAKMQLEQGFKVKSIKISNLVAWN
ncbi:hypothetical protein [Nostoc sp.]